MSITLTELEARIRAARDQEYILAWLLSGQAISLSPDEIPQRIEELGDTYQRIIGALCEMAGLLDRNQPLADPHPEAALPLL